MREAKVNPSWQTKSPTNAHVMPTWQNLLSHCMYICGYDMFAENKAQPHAKLISINKYINSFDYLHFTNCISCSCMSIVYTNAYRYVYCVFMCWMHAAHHMVHMEIIARHNHFILQPTLNWYRVKGSDHRNKHFFAYCVAAWWLTPCIFPYPDAVVIQW